MIRETTMEVSSRSPTYPDVPEIAAIFHLLHTVLKDTREKNL